MLTETLQKKLAYHEEQQLTRKRYAISQRKNSEITLNNNRLINFASNDYLGLTTHANIKRAFLKGVEEFGLGSGASAMVSGFFAPHFLLEEKFAEFINRDQAILFNTGYLANVGVMTTLADRNTVILADKLCHASLLDGIQLSRAKHYRYPHLDTNYLKTLLNKQNKSCLIVTESVFSMEGDICPLNELAKLTTNSAHNFIVDDAHGMGVLGKTGRGICEHYQLSQREVACLISPLGKIFGGMGALVSGSKTIIESLIQFARTYRYSTALPPAVAVALLESLKIIENETWRREKLHSLINFFTTHAKALALPLISDANTPIKSILIGNNKIALQIKDELMQHGFFISCIRPPTVPKNTARIRLSLNCHHEENEILQLLELIGNAIKKLK